LKDHDCGSFWILINSFSPCGISKSAGQYLYIYTRLEIYEKFISHNII
jgi:hypothetical protein